MTIELTARLEHDLIRLQNRHKELDESIARGYTNYLGDKHLNKMKQEKLIVKRQLEETYNRLRNR
jgi:uncharacterized protein YdcH (DUF465 family)